MQSHATAGFLGVVHRFIGCVCKGCEGASVLRKHGRTNARRNVKFAATNHEGGGNGVGKRSTDAVRLLGGAGAAYEYRKLVPTEPSRYRVFVAESTYSTSSSPVEVVLTGYPAFWQLRIVLLPSRWSIELTDQPLHS